MLKKLFISIIIPILFCLPVFAVSHSKKHKTIPIYFYENVNKKDCFEKLDNYLQEKKYSFSMYYPELGFVHTQKDDISILIKQFGNDVYLIVYPPEKKSGKLEDIHKFSEDVSNHLKALSKNSYPIIDEYFFIQLEKDVKQIRETKKSCIQEDSYNPSVYTFSTKRYVGYKKYKPSKLDKAKEKAQHKIDKKFYKDKEKAQKYLEKQQKKLKKQKKSDL